jgi:hypothetical protein
MPLLKNPEAPWDRPALTTHGRNNHSLRSRRWRYIRYHDGTEELYDRATDPLEWTNLAGDDRYAAIKQQLAAWLPKKNAENSEFDRGTRKERKAKKGAKKKAKAKAASR